MNLAAIEFRHLRYFAAVVEQGSFRGAALRLHVSQPPLTRQVQQLEQVLGTVLLVRKPRGVEPTDAGQVFYEEVRNILMLTEQAASRAQLAGQGQLGRLDIGIFGSAVFGAIPRIIQTFRERFPRVEIALHNLDRAGQIRALRERRLTVGFNRLFEEEPDLSWEVIQTEALKVALHESHPLAGAAELGLEQLANQTLIVYPRTPRPSFIEQTLKLFHRRSVTMHSIQEVDDVVTAVALVASRFGLSLVTESACNLRLPGIVYVPLRIEDRATFDLCMIRRRDDDSRLLHEFLAVARGLRQTLSTPAPVPALPTPPPGVRRRASSRSRRAG
uniref:Transcriptional regulator n=1 Tax=uncultured bacterium 50 TaxID=1748278 RepID=A0A0U3KD53_9BACT|nr:transcriptional regulator [uncultured bacterium 50]